MSRTAVLALLSLACITASAHATTVYTTDGTDTTDWSPNVTTSTTPGTLAHPSDTFLGRFGNGNGEAVLALSDLAAHTTVTVTFDLYMIQSTDGNGPDGGGPDPWGLSYISADTAADLATAPSTSLIQTNFNNYDLDNNNTQDFGGPDGLGGYITGGHFPGYTGATEVKTLGYMFNGEIMDSVYAFSFTFNDSNSALALDFTSAFNEDLNTNESWGLDNVTVSTNTPEPASLSLLALGAASLLTRRRK